MHKVIIDTDPGIDDAMAIFWAMQSPDIELVGMTSVFGNVSIDVATRNALVLGDVGAQPVPVAKGAAVPLKITPNPVSDYVHGAEGFGDIPAQSTARNAEPLTAAQFIVETIRANPGEITLCPIGPLTNIAAALVLDPGIAALTKSVVIMGGSLSGGNVTAAAEANIWNDPHAADLVFSADWPMTLVGLDVTNQVQCPQAYFDALAEDAPKMGGFLAKATKFYIAFYASRSGEYVCSLHDPTAVIAIAHSSLFEVESTPLQVILNGDAIGETIRSGDPKRRAVNVCVGVDVESVKRVFADTIRSGH